MTQIFITITLLLPNNNQQQQPFTTNKKIYHGAKKGKLKFFFSYTVCKYKNFSDTQILREINFGHFEAPKNVILIIWAAPNFEFLQTFDIFKCAIFVKN